MPLTDTAIKNAKAGAKPRKLFDGGGLYLLVTPQGQKLWRLKYRFGRKADGIGQKEKLLALGSYPEVPLAGRKDRKTGKWIDGAREKRDHARQLLAADIDPADQRKAERDAKTTIARNSFELIAREWHAGQARKWATVTAKARLARLETDVFPKLGNRPVQAITAPELLRLLKRIENRGAHEIARRVLQMLSQIFRYAIATGRADRDPAADLRGALEVQTTRHHAAVTEPKAVGALLRAIQGYQGEPVTQAALRLAPLVFVRPGELRQAEWPEFDLDEGMWRIPAARMKMKTEHLVPLSKQAIAILRDLEPFTNRERAGTERRYVFPGVRSRARPMSENTLNAALRRLGYTNEEMTAHGFRTIATTLLNEMGWNADAIERQLGHAEGNSVRAAYNRAEHLPERREMMQAWADYLGQLAAGADVVPLKKGRAKR
ncbi:MAG: tyrosine-type recombinase/integrase [Gammaproteobacteria bacterium]